MRGVLRRGVERTLDHLSHLRVGYCPGPTRTILVSQPFDAILHKPAAPFADGVFINSEAFGYFLALKPLGAQQDHSASIR
jgi:hypothetical protein